ncbi:cytochrome P450 [Lichtheimia hyalospora FSU 10163]|nr:cytochrome P450 [Lichtheimia hyalospora FSU 10163]
MGPILLFHMGSKPWVVISDPDIAHELLNVHGVSTSHRPRHTYGTRLQSQDHGLTYIDPGSRWKKIRAASMYYLSPKHLDTCVDILELESDCVLNRLISFDEQPVGVLRHLKLFTMNIALTLGFAQRIEHPDDPMFDTFMQLIETSIQHADPLFDRRAFLPLIMGLVDWCAGTEKKLTRLMEQVRDPLLQQLIQDGIKSDQACLVKKLDTMRDDDVNDKAIIGTCYDFLVAGTDTASTTLSWAMIILCNHPKEQHQLQEEMDAFIHEYRRLPRFEERDHFPLLNSTQKECMRMRPISPLGLSRRVVKDTVCQDYLIPKETTLCANIYAMNHDVHVYPDPHQFKLDRFLSNPRPMATLAKARVDERDHFTFGFGRRSCPGAYLGELEMFHIWVRLLVRATIKPPLDQAGNPMYPDMNKITNGGGVIFPAQDKLRLVPRENPLHL